MSDISTPTANNTALQGVVGTAVGAGVGALVGAAVAELFGGKHETAGMLIGAALGVAGVLYVRSDAFWTGPSSPSTSNGPSTQPAGTTTG